MLSVLGYLEIRKSYAAGESMNSMEADFGSVVTSLRLAEILLW